MQAGEGGRETKHVGMSCIHKPMQGGRERLGYWRLNSGSLACWGNTSMGLYI